MNKKELKRLLEEEYAWDNLYTESNKWFIDELLGDFLDILKKQLTLTDVVGQSEQLVCGCGKKCEKFNKEVEQVKIDLGSSSYW